MFISNPEDRSQLLNEVLWKLENQEALCFEERSHLFSIVNLQLEGSEGMKASRCLRLYQDGMKSASTPVS